jgi:hypothetical protein
LFLFIEPNRFMCFGFPWGPQWERAASTMNQSDMRGLVPVGPEPTGSFSVASAGLLRSATVCSFLCVSIATCVILVFTTGSLVCMRLCCRKVIIRDCRWPRATDPRAPVYPICTRLTIPEPVVPYFLHSQRGTGDWRPSISCLTMCYRRCYRIFLSGGHRWEERNRGYSGAITGRRVSKRFSQNETVLSWENWIPAFAGMTKRLRSSC